MVITIATACSLFEESLVLYREVGDKEAIAWSLSELGERCRVQGDARRGESLFKESLVMFRELGNKKRDRILPPAVSNDALFCPG